MPPWRRVVEASTWVNDSKTEARCLGTIPIPVSVDDEVDRVEPAGPRRRVVSADLG